MGATLRYAKVVDRDHLQAHGGLSPRTDNVVLLPGQPPVAARDFFVLRAWDHIDTAVDETWRIEDAHGRVLYKGTPRTVLAEQGDLTDEVQGMRFEYAADDYQLVLEVDGREVARAAFTVAVTDDPAVAAPPASARETTPADVEAASTPTSSPSDDAVVRDLSEVDQRVLDATAVLEATGTPGFARDIAERAGVSLDSARAALSRLTGPHDLVQEVPTGAGDDPDLGPRYRVKARP
jgi:hypothetical protein